MRNETGEYEVVVGNPQLLAAFGIVVLLCAAAFIMGYEVGQNAPHQAKTDAASSAAAQPPYVTAPAPPATPPASPAPETDTSAAQPPAGDSAPPAEQPPQPTTQPARETPPPAATAPQAAAPAPQVAAMPSGSYCQAMAVRQAADAQSLIQTLKDGGMPATLQTGSDGWVRVMVGPYQNRADLSSAKTELESRFQIRGPICK